MTSNKEDILMIANRIKTEQRKHAEDIEGWERIAAIKIMKELKRRGATR